MKQNKSLREEIEDLMNSSSNMMMSATSTGYDNFIDGLLSLIERERERAEIKATGKVEDQIFEEDDSRSGKGIKK